MKLYIPEIGDSFTLEKDWNFTLYPEGRNETLGELFGVYLPSSYYGKWVPLTHPKLRANVYRDDQSDDYKQYWIDYENHRNECDRIAQDSIQITLKKGTILSVDRVYIRKGSSDFSSITFYAKNIGEIIHDGSSIWGQKKPKKVKAFRFWAKLADCNNIEFSKD